MPLQSVCIQKRSKWIIMCRKRPFGRLVKKRWQLHLAHSFACYRQVGRVCVCVSSLIKLPLVCKTANIESRQPGATHIRKEFYNRNKQATHCYPKGHIFLPPLRLTGAVLSLRTCSFDFNKYSPAWLQELLDHWESHWDLAFLPFLQPQESHLKTQHKKNAWWKMFSSLYSNYAHWDQCPCHISKAMSSIRLQLVQLNGKQGLHLLFLLRSTSYFIHVFNPIE